MDLSSIISMQEKRNKFFSKNTNLDDNDKYVAMEVTNKVINVEDTPMQIKLVTDKLIGFNQLKPVDNPIMYERGRIPTVGGLFSTYIFGTTSEERMKTCAYVDLKKKFIHPYVYEIIKKIFRNIDKIAAGEGSWKINEDGTLIEIKDENSPDYNEDNTGLQWFIDNYDKITFKENDTLKRTSIMELLSISKDQIFITKWIVIPVFYRDEDLSTGKPSRPKINYDYANLIKYANMLENEDFSYFNNKAMFNIQMLLVKIRKYGQSLIEKKKGAFHQTVLGKSIDFGARSVISVPVMNDIETPDEMPVDILHTGVPLAQCIILGYPLMIKWCMDFFRREFDGVQKKTIYIKDKKTNTVRMEEVEIEDQMMVFTKNYIHKKMKGFMNTYGKRFEPIKIKLKDGKEVDMLFTGRGMSRKKDDPKSATISNRAMTWTDVFYMAAVETLSDKHIYTTRYPISDYFGIFPSRCRPLSTVKTTPAVINDVVYPYYPIIDPTLSEEEISTQFIDTLEISNLYLDAIGGD